MERLSVKAVACAAAILWGVAVLIIGAANLIWPDYGVEFLDMVASVYPGYDGFPTVRSVLIGTGYAIVDGAIGGCIFAWLYNLCAGRKKS